MATAPVAGAYAHPRCYASRFGNCAQKIEREHYISEGVLRVIGDTITIVGASWLGGAPKRIPAGRFCSKVLCTNHHRPLSGLDATAKRVFKAILSFNEELSRSVPQQRHREICVRGWDFERWVLKLYCGMRAAGHLRDSAPIPNYILDALYTDERLPLDVGLYMGGHVGDFVSIGRTLSVHPLYPTGSGEMCGIGIALGGVAFHCSLRPARAGGTGKVDGRDRHVPGLVMQDRGRSRELTFDWS